MMRLQQLETIGFFIADLQITHSKFLAKFVIKLYPFSIFSTFERILSTFSGISLLSNDGSPVVLDV